MKDYKLTKHNYLQVLSSSLGELGFPNKFSRTETYIYRLRKIVNKQNQSNLTQSPTTAPYDKEKFSDPRTLVSIMSVLLKINYRTIVTVPARFRSYQQNF